MSEYAELRWRTAKSGALVPEVATAGRWYALHSLIDPRREAQQIADRAPQTTTLVCLGFGGGYHIAALLRRPQLRLLIVIDETLDLMREAAKRTGLTDCLADDRLVLSTDSTADPYLPILHGSIAVCRLFARVRTAPAFFDRIAQMVVTHIEARTADFATQSRFGRLWFRNIITNATQMSAVPAPQPLRLPVRPQTVTVIGAGPSVDAWATTDGPPGDIVVVVDAALYAVQQRGVTPDLAVAIDPQPYGYLHWLGTVDGNTPVLVDIGIHPTVFARLRRRIVTGSHHPLVTYLAMVGRPLPRFQYPAGNVGLTAVALAVAMQPQFLTVFGVELGYRHYQAYARGTLLTRHFDHGATRLTPPEAESWRYCAGTGDRHQAMVALHAQGRDELSALTDTLVEWHGRPELSGRYTAAVGASRVPTFDRTVGALPGPVADWFGALVDDLAQLTPTAMVSAATSPHAPGIRTGGAPITGRQALLAVGLLPLAAAVARREAIAPDATETLFDRTLDVARGIVGRIAHPTKLCAVTGRPSHATRFRP